MKKENWITNTNRVLAWLEIEDRGEAAELIQMSITLGNKSKSEEMLTNYWTAIRNIGSEFTDFPKARVGSNDILDTQSRVHADSVHQNLMNAFATIGEDELILTTVLPHGRTGGVYDSMQSFAKVIADKAVRDLVIAYKEKRWTGKMNGNVPVVKPRPLNTNNKTEDGGSEEV